jgi:small conductance mechanosensitive channel
LLSLLLLFAISAAPTTTASAQTPSASAVAVKTPPQAPVADIEALVGILENEAERAAFVARLKTLIEVSRAPAPESPVEQLGELAFNTLAARINQISSQIVAVVDVAAAIPRIWSWARDIAMDATTREVALEVFVKLTIVLGAGLLAEALARLFCARFRRSLYGRGGLSMPMKAWFLLVRTLIDLVPIAAFGIAANLTLPLTEPRLLTNIMAATLIYGFLLARAVNVLARMLLAPHAPNLRLIPLGDETAQYLNIWARRFTVTWVYGFYVLQSLVPLGLPNPGYEFILRLLGLTVAAMAAVFVLQNRLVVGAWLRREPERATEDLPVGSVVGGLRAIRLRLAEVWHALALFYVAAIYLVWSLAIPGGFRFILEGTVLTGAILSLARFASLGQRRIIQYAFSVTDEVKDRFPLIEKRANLYLPVLKGTLDAVIAVFLVLALLQAWGMESFAWFATDLGRRTAAIVVTIALTLGGGILVWEIVSVTIERMLRRYDGLGSREHGQRMRTFLPLVKNAVLIAIVVVVGLVVLSELGVNIAPLLAGAGVIGLAIGFGSQALVKDVITGLFILFEDTINVGDVVDLDGKSGVVESISIRTIRLRDLHGSQLTIPFSQVNTVKNMTRDFGYYVFDLNIAYESDIDRATAVLREVDAEIQKDAEFGGDILAPIEILGLDKFLDFSVMLRARIKARPGQQWRVGREYNRRIKVAFAANGIEIPYPHQVQVHKAGEAALPAPEAPKA